MALPLSSAKLIFFFQAVRVQKLSFLTNDLQGKVSVVQILGDLAELFPAFEKELLVYEWMPRDRKKKTLLPYSL